MAIKTYTKEDAQKLIDRYCGWSIPEDEEMSVKKITKYKKGYFDYIGTGSELGFERKDELDKILFPSLD